MSNVKINGVSPREELSYLMDCTRNRANKILTKCHESAEELCRILWLPDFDTNKRALFINAFDDKLIGEFYWEKYLDNMGL